MEQQKVLFPVDLESELTAAVAECGPDLTFVLCDDVTQRQCLPLVSSFDCLKGAKVITIGSTDQHKTLDSLAHVWEELGSHGATRHSLLINIGGGMVTDLGGFAASTFKRGISYINLPTTLLSMVDASVGGKTGINFRGLKNEIGVFSNAHCVLLHTPFLKTLDLDNLLSGYAEMLKHSLIADTKMWAEHINFEWPATDYAACIDTPSFRTMLQQSVSVKQRIVTEDPTEQGIRKALNLGHTVGHAFESLALQRTPILHGYAVAYGLIVELYLSCLKTGFPMDKMRETVNYIRSQYGRMEITCDDYPTLLELMTHDKKNVAGTINFTLLADVGELRLNQTATQQEIYEALDFYREG